MADPQTGPGDFFDPAVHGLDDVDLAPGASSGAGSAPSANGDDGDDDGVRASEIDDLTGATPRPDAGQPDGLDVAALVAERDEMKEIAQRVQAEYDNFRRQSQVRTQADIDRATGRLAEALLPVLDAAEAAFLNHPDEVGPLLNQMLVELKKQGLEAMDLDGQPFDPERAEAVAHEPGAGGDPVVAEVLRSGYAWKGKTLRAAMVRTKD